MSLSMLCDTRVTRCSRGVISTITNLSFICRFGGLAGWMAGATSIIVAQGSVSTTRLAHNIYTKYVLWCNSSKY